jgi:hypothetical protein
MDKKPLIVGSILTVVLLVLGSLSNVVGYQSVKSTSVNDSPLFQTRTLRATNQQQKIITSHYLGIENEKNIQFPLKDNRIEQLKKYIDILGKMNDKIFTRFIELFILNIKQIQSLKDIPHSDIIKAFYLLRTEPEIIKNSILSREKITTSNNTATSNGFYPTQCVWVPGCLILNYILFILDTICLLLILFTPTSSLIRTCYPCITFICPLQFFSN